ncbi:hypothetical protein QM797_22140 [Rhodococcus sp. IEGM 1381]|uniref:hypothetical protein n=1 Tax=Rhodococcus sp. IEGM 1381 TaxID=3047085 RepID=UPI0024B7E36D|nr:hypothetical protein [Rhodococcus sp. IEGM 1381]MDI9897428.1 hypothetical protein [Rhodococcus sp. IEGM 1381]
MTRVVREQGDVRGACQQAVERIVENVRTECEREFGMSILHHVDGLNLKVDRMGEKTYRENTVRWGPRSPCSLHSTFERFERGVDRRPKFVTRGRELDSVCRPREQRSPDLTLQVFDLRTQELLCDVHFRGSTREVQHAREHKETRHLHGAHSG